MPEVQSLFIGLTGVLLPAGNRKIDNA